MKKKSTEKQWFFVVGQYDNGRIWSASFEINAKNKTDIQLVNKLSVLACSKVAKDNDWPKTLTRSNFKVLMVATGNPEILWAQLPIYTYN